jgi:hypothetical protein
MGNESVRCAHRVDAVECVKCFPGTVAVVATCAGCGVERSMSIPARAGTVVAKHAVFLCVNCTPYGSAIRGQDVEFVRRKRSDDFVEIDAHGCSEISEEYYEQPEATDIVA